jgi:hypothetical protein
MELTTSLTPSFCSVATTVSSLSALVVHTCGRGGLLCVGWGLVRFWVILPDFFGQPLDMCPCYLQKKQRPLAMSCHFSSLLSGLQVLMASTSSHERRILLLVCIVQNNVATGFWFPSFLGCPLMVRK